MRETNREQIRRALDECLSGMDGRPSLKSGCWREQRESGADPDGFRWRWRWRC